jgi:hypothetical protein
MDEPMIDDTQHPEAELARLADGTLPADRETELRAELERSPQLTSALAEQQHAVTLLRALGEPAPEGLRTRIGEMTVGRAGHAGRSRGQRTRTRRRIPAIGTGLAAVAAAVVAVIILAGGAGSAPTVVQTTRLSLAAATMPAPALNPGDANRLAVQAAGIPFPSWRQARGWHASGARTDTLGGRRVVTVFYTSTAGQRIGYSIVAGTPLATPVGATERHYGVRFTLRDQDGARIVTWRNSGHTCVIATRSVSYGALVALAVADEQTSST